MLHKLIVSLHILCPTIHVGPYVPEKKRPDICRWRVHTKLPNCKADLKSHVRHIDYNTKFMRLEDAAIWLQEQAQEQATGAGGVDAQPAQATLDTILRRGHTFQLRKCNSIRKSWCKRR